MNINNSLKDFHRSELDLFTIMVVVLIIRYLRIFLFLILFSLGTQLELIFEFLMPTFLIRTVLHKSKEEKIEEIENSESLKENERAFYNITISTGIADSQRVFKVLEN